MECPVRQTWILLMLPAAQVVYAQAARTYESRSGVVLWLWVACCQLLSRPGLERDSTSSRLSCHTAQTLPISAHMMLACNNTIGHTIGVQNRAHLISVDEIIRQLFVTVNVQKHVQAHRVHLVTHMVHLYAVATTTLV